MRPFPGCAAQFLDAVFGITAPDPKTGREGSRVIHPQSAFATCASAAPPPLPPPPPLSPFTNIFDVCWPACPMSPHSAASFYASLFSLLSATRFLIPVFPLLAGPEIFSFSIASLIHVRMHLRSKDLNRLGRINMI
jgi:hypothetical protein